MNFLYDFRYNSVYHIRNFDYNRNVVDAKILIALHSCDQTIVTKTFVQIDVRFYWNHSFDLFLNMFILIFDVFDILTFDFDIRNRTIEIVVLKLLLDDLNIIYEKSISHKCFDKMRKLFQLFWRFWSVVIVVNNRKLETIDVCRWKREQNRMIEINCCML